MPDVAKGASVLGDIAALLNAVVWPACAAIFLWRYHAQVTRLFNVVIDKVERAKTIKAAGIEIADEEIKQALAAVTTVPDAKEIPKVQVQDATLLANSLNLAGVTRVEAATSAKSTWAVLAQEYDQIRASQPSSRERTNALDRIVAKMRTLGLLARPFLPSLMASNSAGERLVAIASLQVKPDAMYLDWLAGRMAVEQPFMLFHAALALRQAVTDRAFESEGQMRTLLENALSTVNSFRHGLPDKHTVSVLKEATDALNPYAERLGDV